MSQEATEIKMLKNGPYRVKGVTKVIDPEGNEVEVKEVYSLCRCGASENKPFCDGSHKEVKFAG